MSVLPFGGASRDVKEKCKGKIATASSLVHLSIAQGRELSVTTPISPTQDVPQKLPASLPINLGQNEIM